MYSPAPLRLGDVFDSMRPMHPHPTSDAEIISISRGDPERFSEIFDRHFTQIHNYINQRVNGPVADDIAAEVFLIAFRRRNEFDTSHDSVRPWLYGITTRLMSRHFRSELRRYQALVRLHNETSVESHDDRVVAAVTAESAGLAGALASLSQGDRDVFLLAALADLTYEEIAAALGIKYGTVCSRLSRARRTLRFAIGNSNPLNVEGDLNG